jgi:hypothetical protein
MCKAFFLQAGRAITCSKPFHRKALLLERDFLPEDLRASKTQPASQ